MTTTASLLGTRSRARPGPEELPGLEADIAHEDDASNDSVRDDGTVALLCQLQAETAIDHTQQHQDAAPPDVHIADGAASLRLQVVPVVQESEGGLDPEQGDDDGPKDGMRLVQELLEAVS